MRIRSLLLLLSLLLTTACNSAVQSVPSTQMPASAQTPVATNTAIAASATPTTTEPPTQTPTDSPVPVTATPTLQPASATLFYNLVTRGTLLTATQMLSPVGSPLQSWHDVPIMPQATAGQDMSSIYIYRPHATLDQARQFYTSNSQSLGLTNSSGPESSGKSIFAGHDFIFLGYKLAICIFSASDSTDYVTVGISWVP